MNVACTDFSSFEHSTVLLLPRCHNHQVTPSEMSLRTQRCIPELKKYYNSLSWLHSHPFCWPYGSSAPFQTSNLLVKIHCYINVQLAIVYFVFVAYRALQVYHDRNETLELRLYIGLAAVLYASIAFWDAFLLLRSDSFVRFQRSQLKFVSNGKTRMFLQKRKNLIVFWNMPFCSLHGRSRAVISAGPKYRDDLQVSHALNLLHTVGTWLRNRGFKPCAPNLSGVPFFCSRWPFLWNDFHCGHCLQRIPSAPAHIFRSCCYNPMWSCFLFHILSDRIAAHPSVILTQVLI